MRIITEQQPLHGLRGLSLLLIPKNKNELIRLKFRNKTME